MPPDARRIVLSLSGGGFRATLFHLGVVLYLAEKKLLSRVERIVGISGGSVLAGHLCTNWQSYLADSTRPGCVKQLLQFCAMDVRGRVVRRAPLYWLVRQTLDTFGRGASSHLDVLKYSALTHLLMTYYDRLYQGKTLGSLAPSAPKTYFVSTSLRTGLPAYFALNEFRLLDKTDGARHVRSSELPVALAVCASSAFPLLFPPLLINAEVLRCSNADFPGSDFLTDGGVYDNLGIRLVHECLEQWDLNDDCLVLISNAEAYFDSPDDARQVTPLLERTFRSSDIAANNVTKLAWDVVGLADSGSRIRSKEHNLSVPVLHLNISEEFDADSYLSPEEQRALRHVRTDLDCFSQGEMHALIYHGYRVAQSHLANDNPAGRLTPQMLATSKFAPVTSASLWQASRRRWRLWAPSDWISWVHLLLAAILGFAAYKSVFEPRIEEIRQVRQAEYFRSHATAAGPGLSVSFEPLYTKFDDWGRLVELPLREPTHIQGMICCIVQKQGRRFAVAAKTAVGCGVRDSPVDHDVPEWRILQPAYSLAQWSGDLPREGELRYLQIGTVTECAEDLDVALVELRVESRNSIPWFTPFRRSLEFASMLAPSALSGKSLLVAYRHTGVEACKLVSPNEKGLIRIRHGQPGQPGQPEQMDPRNAPVGGSPVFTLEGELVGMVTIHVHGGSLVLPIERILSRFNVNLAR